MKDIIKQSHYKIQQIIKNLTGKYSEDIEQEVYIRVFKNIDKYKEQNKFLGWISTITSNICKDYLKSLSYKNSKNTISDENFYNVSDYKTPEKTYSSKERQKIILKEIDKLPKKLKETIILYEFEDYSYEQIAKKLNISIGTVKSRLNSARTTLKEKLSFLLEQD